MVSALLEAGAQVDASDNFGETALFVAANAGNRAIVVSLLEAGANANKKDKQHNTPLFRAAALCSGSRCVRNHSYSGTSPTLDPGG